ncbi:GNAT family N-acetyltransferase [Nocardiopsis sp. RSe5-2]|uniref:GNAT family N-acetyltransferase n=1 Tax=Nocardiopsis endophytica TaxID=3018445 RepID=A0ABT4UB25_9ACTN|nr:GNAT family N-acetyltransferase [Nocardiopsis endophytica]MDA2814140.1 GNAT family N-acetyltransferase [Nocardiopsis endophytica]
METDTGPLELWEPAPPAFVHALPALLEVYTAAMDPPPEQLPGRRTIMEQHARHPRFKAVLALRPAEAPGASGTEAGLAGFAYGFHGHRGQWWFDVVTEELRRRDPAAERRWFRDTFEVAEVHVRPAMQGHGIGRTLLERLTAARPERAAVLSTRTGSTVARRLYGSCGFVDVLPEFSFPGSPDQPFAIMAARLPLRGRGGRRRSAGRSRGWRWTG